MAHRLLRRRTQRLTERPDYPLLRSLWIAGEPRSDQSPRAIAELRAKLEKTGAQCYVPATMLAPIVEFFERLLTDFSWRRLALVLALAVFVALVGGVYEWYTASYRLARIDRQLTLLERLTKLENDGSLASHEYLRRIARGLRRDLAATVPGPAEGMPLAAKKVLAAGVPWALLAIAVAAAEGGLNGRTFAGMLIVALPCLGLAAWLPTFDRPWINYVGYPVGHMAIVVVLIMVWQASRTRPSSAPTSTE